jgi:hypothetical protein
MANNRRMIQFLTPDVGFVLYLGMGTRDFSPRDAGSVWRSTDAGISWSKILDHRYTALTTVHPTFVVAGGVGGSFATSRDAGATWNEDKLTIDGHIVAVSALGASNIIIATTNQQVLSSTDGGKTWNNILTSSRTFEILDLVITSPGKWWLLQRPTDHAIRTAAYYRWLAHRDDRNYGDDDKADWYAAEKQLLSTALQYTAEFGGSRIATGLPSPFSNAALRRTDYDEVILLIPFYGCVSARFLEDHISLSRMPARDPCWCCDAIDNKTVCVGGTFFWTTQDAGATWQEVALSDNLVIDVFLLDQLRGWALAASYGGNMVWGTIDGGLTWTRLTQPRLVHQGGQQFVGLASPFEYA